MIIAHTKEQSPIKHTIRHQNSEIREGFVREMARRRSPALEEFPPSTRSNKRTLPILGGDQSDTEVCYYCFFSPCVVHETVLPDFVRGSAAPHLGNLVKRYRLYQKFSTHLKRLGLWDFPPYKSRKRRQGHEHSPDRDMTPCCVKKMVRERFPNPPELPYTDHCK